MRHRGSRRLTVAERLQSVLIHLCYAESRTATDGMLSGVGVRARLIVTLLYLLCLLSLPPLSLLPLLFYGLYTLAICRLLAVGYMHLLRHSLVVLPFILMVGVFNPLFDHTRVTICNGVEIGGGWITLFTLLARGLLAVQSVVLLLSVGFYRICGAIRSLGMPSLLVGQLQLLYRHLFLIVEEAMAMSRAVAARGYGRSSYPLRLWGKFVAQLLMLSIGRAERLHRSMVARGFNGYIPCTIDQKWSVIDTLYLVLNFVVLVVIRFYSV